LTGPVGNLSEFASRENTMNANRIILVSLMMIAQACSAETPVAEKSAPQANETTPEASKAAPKPAQGVATYVIDSNHTHVMFSVNRFGFTDTIGTFPESSGEIVFDEANPANSSVSAKVKTGSVWTGLEERDGHMRGEHWLNTDANPEISFSSTSVTTTGDDKRFNVTGNLTIWGESVPVTFDTTLNQLGPDRTADGKTAVGFSIKGTIKRSDFGHKTALGFVGDEVDILIETMGHKK